MLTLLELDSRSFHSAPEPLIPYMTYLDALRGMLPRSRWSGRFVRDLWRAAVDTDLARIENGVKTVDGKFWRWALYYAKDGVVAIILVPEPDKDEPIAVLVENGVDDKTATDTLKAPLAALAEQLRKKLREYSRKISRSP